MGFEDLRGHARPVPDRDERTVQIRRLAPAPEENLGRIPLRAARASRRTGSFVTNTSVAKASTCARGQSGPAAAILPPKMRIARSLTLPSTATVTSHPAIARSKISPPSDVTTSAMFVATMCSR